MSGPPPDRPPFKWDECPHGCGFRALAADQKMSADEFWIAGPWKMSVHLASRKPGDRCGRTFYQGPPNFTVPELDENGELITTTTER